MQVALGADVSATIAAPGDLDVGARIETPVTRRIAAYWRRAAFDVASGEWSVTLDCPVAAGDYQFVWRTGDPEPPVYEVFVPLTVT